MHTQNSYSSRQITIYVVKVLNATLDLYLILISYLYDLSKDMKCNFYRAF